MKQDTAHAMYISNNKPRLSKQAMQYSSVDASVHTVVDGPHGW